MSTRFSVGVTSDGGDSWELVRDLRVEDDAREHAAKLRGEGLEARAFDWSQEYPDDLIDGDAA